MTLGLTTAVQAADVSFYGVIDTAVQSYDNGESRLTRSANNLYQISRVGIRGREDLGDGLRAQFQLESQLNPSTGSVGSTTTATNEVFNREAWVGLGHQQFGDVRLGRTDVTMASELDIWTSPSKTLGTNPVNRVALEQGIDQKSTIKYVSPTVKGFTLQVGHHTGNDTGTTVDNNASGTGTSLQFEQGPVKLGVGYHKLEANATADSRDAWSVAGAYDFGIAVVQASYVRGDNSTTGKVTSESGVVQVAIPVTARLRAHVIGTTATDGSQSTENRGYGGTLAATYAFSKRTLVYVAYTQVHNQANSRMYMTGTSLPTAGGLDTSATSMGISMTF